MIDFVKENSEIIRTVTNVAMLVIWITYLQLFLMSYMRQRRSSILVNRGAGRGVEARCLISNMSAEPIYVQSIMAVLQDGGREWTASVTDVEELGDNSADIGKATNQGPLHAGDYMDIGSFKSLARRAAEHAGAPVGGMMQDYDSLELIVVAAYASERKSVAARRRFQLESGGRLIPSTVSTRQIRFGPERKRIVRHHAKYL